MQNIISILFFHLLFFYWFLYKIIKGLIQLENIFFIHLKNKNVNQ